jgi:hypothetical protein
VKQGRQLFTLLNIVVSITGGWVFFFLPIIGRFALHISKHNTDVDTFNSVLLVALYNLNLEYCLLFHRNFKYACPSKSASAVVCLNHNFIRINICTHNYCFKLKDIIPQNKYKICSEKIYS